MTPDELAEIRERDAGARTVNEIGARIPCTQDRRDLLAEVERLTAERERLREAARNWVPKFRKMEAVDGAVELTVTDAHEVVEGITEAFAKMLDESHAVNYVECEMKAAGGPRYLFTIQRYQKPTPHQLREQAEAERDVALAAIERVRREHARGTGDHASFCDSCDRTWPCPTITILDAADGAHQQQTGGES